MTKKTALVWATLLALVAGAGSVLAQSQGTAPGVLVSAVAPNGPAEKAGIARGDIILSVSDKDVSTPRDVVQAVGSSKTGDTVAVKISHGDATRTVQVTLEARDDRPYMGIMLVPSLAEHSPRPSLRPFAAIITEVAPGSPAAQAGLQPRDVVVSVDGTSLDAGHSLVDLIGGHKAGDTVTLSIARPGGHPQEIEATLAQNPAKADGAYLGVRYGTFASRGDDRRPRMWNRGPQGERRSPT